LGDVLPDLLESLEQEKSQMSEVYKKHWRCVTGKNRIG